MKKPNFNISQFFKRVVDKTKNLFRRKKDIEYFEDEYDDEWDDATDPSLTPLTVTDIKRKNIESGDSPPDLPDFGIDDDDDEDYAPDDSADIQATNPSYKEFNINHSKGNLKDKAGAVFTKLATRLKKPSLSPSFALQGTKSEIVEKVMTKIKDINPDEIFEKIFSPQNRPLFHRAFLIIFFVGSSYEIGKLIGVALSPTAGTAKLTTSVPPRLNRSDVLKNKLSKLRDNDLFGAPEEMNSPIITPKGPKAKEIAVCRESDKRSSLNLTLVNTVVLQDSVKSLASVQMRTGKDKEQFLREGDKIPGQIEVGKITRQKLIFKNLRTRQCEFIESKKDQRRPKKTINIVKDPAKGKQIIEDSKDTGIKNVGNTFKIKKAVRDDMLSNISEVLTQARAVQIKNPDGSLAFRMQEIVPGSIYSKLNIQEGDIVSGINGKKISDMSELMNLFGQIDKVDHFELTLKRDGIEQNLEYDFE